ncbi:hypothetical protein ACIBIZ_52130 [Nonomuraea spiralis]|uniref:hypothetical protein n=1 Tax=Nonomuraea spiralis TaxID=46182 RepID=UPI003792987A
MTGYRPFQVEGYGAKVRPATAATLRQALDRAMRWLDGHPGIDRVVLRYGSPDMRMHVCTLVPDYVARTVRVDDSGTRRPTLATDVAAVQDDLEAGGADEHEGLLYVEGMVVAQRVPVAFDHAWCVRAEAEDQVIDPTLPDGMGVAYLGVALTDGYRCAQQARRGVDAVITGGGINLADNTEVLRDGLPGDAWGSVGRPLPASVPLGERA